MPVLLRLAARATIAAASLVMAVGVYAESHRAPDQS